MNITMPTEAQLLAAGRNVASAVSGGVVVLAALHVISADDVGKVTDAFSQIGSGFASIIGGVTALITIATPIWAAYKASHSSQLDAVASSPDVQKVVMVSKALADAVPSDKVVAPAVLPQGAQPGQFQRTASTTGGGGGA